MKSAPAFHNNTLRDHIKGIVQKISPFDSIEHAHINDTLAWIDSHAPLFRIQKPDIPHKHLVSYFLLVDDVHQKVLLVDHINAQLWLPSGGHVEIDEDPKTTVERECLEELGIEADFYSPDPLFLTSTVTAGRTHNHTDVSLWYVLKGNSQIPYHFDRSEFHEIRWFHMDDIPYSTSDPHMKRFIEKFKNRP